MSTSSSASKPSGMWQPPTLEEMQAMLPQYQFICLLGRGGMGAVYKAVQVSLDRPVAIKVLPGDLVMDEDVQFAERFKNEARTMAKMSHPAIVNVYDFGETQTGLLYIVMEFIDGTDISKLILSQGRLTEEYALAITAHVCDALNYAHRNGVVHRYIKPANILINMAGEIKVADFGLAKANDASQSGGLTKTNMAMGTPDFVAPEAFIPGFALDGRADLYAIGVMLYQMLTGDIPRGMWTMPSQRIGSDPRFDAIIARAMQTDREMRYQSASEIHQDLNAILTTPISVLIQQQQAAAEAATAATRAQKQAEAAPPPAAKKTPSPAEKPRSMLGPVLSIAATLVLGGGLYWLMSKGSEKNPPAGSGTTVGEAPVKTPSVAAPTAKMQEPPPSIAPPTIVASRTFEEGFMPLFKSGSDFSGWTEHAGGPPDKTWAFLGDGMACNVPAGSLRSPEEYADFELRLDWKPAPRGNAAIAYHSGPVEYRDALRMRLCSPQLKPERCGELMDLDLPMIAASVKIEEWNTVRLIVRGSHREHWINEVKVLEYDVNSPAFQRSLTASASKSPNARPGIPSTRGHLVLVNNSGMSYFRHLRIRKLEPAAPAPKPPPTPGAIDLLAGLDVAKNKVSGDWQLVNGELVSDAMRAESEIVLPVAAVPAEYDLRYHLTRINGHQLQFRFGAGERGAIFITDGWSGNKEKPSEVQVKWGGPNSGMILSPTPLLRDSKPHDLVMQVRARSITALLDGREVLRRNVSTTTAGDAASFSLRVAMGKVIYHTIEIIPVGATTSLMTATPTPAPAPIPTQAPTASPAATPADPVIARLDAGFKARHTADAENPFLAALAKLDASYLSNGIPKARAAAQAKGSLADVTALDAEKVRLEKKESVPAEDAADTPEGLKSLRQTYRAAQAKISAERDAKAAPLYAIYLKALDEHITALTKAGKLTEATAAQTWRDQIAAQKPANAAVAAPASPATVKTTPEATPKAASAGGSTWRTAAEFLLNNGGTFVASKNGSNSPVLNAKDIPAGRFDIIELTLDRLNSVLPPLKDKDLLPLVGLRDLRRVWVRPSGSALSDGAFSFLAGNNELNWLNLEGVNEVTDEVLTHLAKAEKLDFLCVQYAPKFTGKSLDQLPASQTLTSLDLLSCGISDDGLKAISSFKQLRVLRITSGTASDKDFTLLGNLKSLTNLTVSTTGFGNKAAEAISTITGLTRLDAAGTKLTNSGLEKLQSLTNLTELILNGTEVSAKAAADFQKALPRCRVSL